MTQLTVDQMLDRIQWVSISALVAMFLLVIVIGAAGGRNHSRLMEQCLKDGHQEYECVGILRE